MKIKKNKRMNDEKMDKFLTTKFSEHMEKDLYLFPLSPLDNPPFPPQRIEKIPLKHR